MTSSEIPRAGELKVGAKLGISCCGCEFIVTGRDPEDPAHVVFKQTKHCKSFCDMAKGQELWLFDDEPITGVPGRHSFILPKTH